ncbi:MAG: hypothetical protein GY789_20105 [Hyphomicrobiales bacterium]|nr:hypothetical protein [Hyphomicrobiales bacterium]MCP4999736.1 hypothetical protein [Hyphomicrobiales bacterium]
MFKEKTLKIGTNSLPRESGPQFPDAETFRLSLRRLPVFVSHLPYLSARMATAAMCGVFVLQQLVEGASL